MNPLDLPGPDFLRFYALFGVVALGIGLAVRQALKVAAGGPAGAYVPGRYPGESEAYHVALLRGRQHAIEAALARLVAQGRVGVDGTAITPSSAESLASLHPFEQEVVRALDAPASGLRGLVRLTKKLAPALDAMEEELARHGLTYGAAARGRFDAVVGVTMLAILGLGAAKLVVALSRGRTNVVFLLIMLLGFGLLTAGALKAPRLTKAGSDYRDWLRRAHQGLLDLVNRGRRTSAGEVALCAAVFGLDTLTIAPVSQLRRALAPPPSTSGDGSSGSSCSSGGSSSCGGGGCGGGGCGGCGG